MKVDEIKSELQTLLARYERAKDSAANRDDSGRNIYVPVSPGMVSAVRECIVRINHRYPEASAGTFAWPYNLLFELGFPVAVRITDTQIEGLDIVMKELLSDIEMQVINCLYKEKTGYVRAADKLGIKTGEGKDIESRALMKLRTPASIRIIENGKDVVREYEEVREELREAAKEYNKQLEYIRQNSRVFNSLLTGEVSPEEIQRIRELINEQNEKMNLPIEDLDLSVSTYKALHAAGFEYAGELSGISRKRLLKIRNIGSRAVEEIEESLVRIGLKIEE